MSEIERISPQFTRIYRTVDDIRRFVLRIRLVDDATKSEEIATFRWQEKKNHGIIFSYTQRDGIVPESPEDAYRMLKPHSGDTPTFLMKLLRSQEEDNIEVMFIMADFGEQFDGGWLRHEHCLATVRYDADRRLLMITPDFTGFTPYALRVHSATTRTFHYFLENATLDGIAHDDLVREITLLEQVRRVQDVNNAPPQKLAEDDVHVVIEILSGKDFDHNCVFLRYFVDLGDGKQSNNATTMTSWRNCNGEYHFDCIFEVSLKSRQSTAILYVEVISKDTWWRFRSEGVAYLVLPTWTPGWRTHHVPCFRLQTNDLRRFFIGDCANFNDLIAIGPNAMKHANRLATTTISSGSLRLRTGIVHITPVSEQQKWRRRETSVQSVVSAFKAARNALIETRNAV